MKKIMPILLVVLLMVGLMPVAAFAADDKTDIITFNKSASATSENGNFELSADNWINGGWGVGPDEGTITIRANKDNLMITRLDAVMEAGGSAYGYVKFGGNVHKEENGPVDSGKTISLTSIDSSEITLSATGGNIKLKDITVHYTGGSDAGSIFSEGNGAIICLIGVAAVIAVVVLVIMKKKKKVA